MSTSAGVVRKHQPWCCTAHFVCWGRILPSLGPFMASLAEDLESVSQAALFLCRLSPQQEQLLAAAQESSRFAALYLDRVGVTCIDEACMCTVRYHGYSTV